MQRLAPARFNAALEHPAVRTVVRFLGSRGADFRSADLVERLHDAPRFPALSVGEVLGAARHAGASLRAGNLPFEELSTIEAPMLTFLRRADGTEAIDLFMVSEVAGGEAVLWRDRFGCESMPLGELGARWSGIVFLLDGAAHRGGTELEAYRRGVRLIDGFVDPATCAALIDYCEAACFERSRVMQRSRAGTSDVLSPAVRSSSSVVLKDRSHPALRPLYARSAAAEGVSEREVEQIQCVRYHPGEQFRTHFDGGVDLPRLTTYLLYLNDDFDGGETFFPLLDLAVSPRTGSCLRFPSCDREGRVLWPSEHGGLPVTRGVKYALNIWVRCPS